MISRIQNRVRYELQQRELRRQAEELRKQLQGSNQYSYTTDYVTPNLSNWEKALGHLAGKPLIRMLEIGSYEGRSSVWFLQNILTDPSARLVCVDLFPTEDLALRFRHNLKLTGAADKVDVRPGRSEQVLTTLGLESFDAIYVDGGHALAVVLVDGLLAWRCLKPGGIMIFDDYLWEMNSPIHQRPQQAIDMILDLLKGQYQVLWKDYQVILQKNA
jgi:predicted O-methyltransferase YrrM